MKMRFKKGLAMGFIISAILVLVLLFGTSYFFAKTSTGGIKGLLGTEIPKDKLKEYTPEDDPAIISMKALACAINSEILGKPAWIQENYSCGTYCDCYYKKAEGITSTPTGAFVLNIFNSAKNKITGFATAEEANPDNLEKDQEQSKPACSGIYYGNNICVECSGFDVSFLKLNENKQEAIKQIGEAAMSCWESLSKREIKDQYTNCYMFSTSKLPSGITITEEEVENWLGMQGERGEALVNAGWIFKSRIDMETISKQSTTVCIYYDDDTWSDDLNIGKCQNKYTSPFRCKVKAFTLPQEIEEAGWASPLNWIAGNNDPNYVAYFESFPRGKDKFWHVDGISIMNVGMIAGFAAFDLLPVFGKVLKGGAKAVTAGMKEGTEEAVEQMTKTGIKASVKEFFENIAKKGWKRTLRQTFLKETLQESVEGIGEKTAKALSDQADEIVEGFFKKLIRKVNIFKSSKKELQEELTESYLKTLKKMGTHLDPAFEQAYRAKAPITELAEAATNPAAAKRLRNKMLNEYREKTAKEMAEQTVEIYSKKLTKEVVQEMTERLAVKNFFKQMFKEGLEEGAERLSKENLQAAIKKSLKQVAGMSPSQRAKAAKKGAELAEQFLDKEGLFDVVKLFGSTVKDPSALKKKFTKDFIEYAGAEEGESLAKMITKAGFKGLKKGTVGEGGATQIIKNLYPGIPILQLGKNIEFIKNHKYPILAALAYYGASQDAVNEKYTAVGTNYLGLDRPFMVGDDDGKVNPFTLVPNASEYFITPELYKGTRLYMASPCKADLVITKTPCECVRQPLDQHYNFGGGTIDVSGIEIKEDPETNKPLIADDDKVYEWVISRKLPDGTSPEMVKFILEKSDEEVTQEMKDSYGEMGCHSPSMANIPAIKKFKLCREIITEYNDSYSIIDINQAKNKKDAVVFYYRTRVLNFFENNINGWGIGQGDISKTTYNEFSYFFDMDHVIKNCHERTVVSSAMGWANVIWKDIWKQELKLEENQALKKTYNTQCITVDITRYEDWNYGANYCIDEYPHLETRRYILMGVEVAASVVATALTGGLATPFIIAGVGVAAGVWEEYWARDAKWPAHNKQGEWGEVPIAQGELTSTDWTITGETGG